MDKRNKKYNFKKVFSTFQENYQLIPLEIYNNDPYKKLISTLLSSRTRDEVTLEASKRLFILAPNLQKLNQLKRRKIEKLIYPVGFYKTKARHVKNLAKIILKDHKGNIPSTREGLMTLPGVGRKTANLVLNRAFQIPAIAVDTHVHRIANLLGWVKTKSPKDTEKELIKIIPKKYWHETSDLFVSIGRRYGTGDRLKRFLIGNNLVKNIVL